MKDFREALKGCSDTSLEQRKVWYSPAAEAYNKARPRYPQQLIQRTVELIQLQDNANILEVGCGPGIATVAFAKLGYNMLCVEPNPDFCSLTRQNCQDYPNIEVINTSFEESQLETNKFDAVLAATSFHWIPAEVGYPKAASCLKDNGYLILLWNMRLEPSYEIYQKFIKIYEQYAPSLLEKYEGEYEGRQKQEEHLKSFGEIVLESGQFQDLITEYIPCELTYSIDDYFALLNSYSPYLNLEPQAKEALFAALREKIEDEHLEGASIQLSFLSGFNIARKLP
ncbi:methyltransferase type 12 [Rivularia sp. IAM M-261]|nr:methyltransferase type 12 [Calothrix sp. PCC 7716]GJD20490.1 methyltransferase type 12 [Rivularia sp. IAM M-261]